MRPVVSGGHGALGKDTKVAYFTNFTISSTCFGTDFRMRATTPYCILIAISEIKFRRYVQHLGELTCGEDVFRFTSRKAPKSLSP